MATLIEWGERIEGPLESLIFNNNNNMISTLLNQIKQPQFNASSKCYPNNSDAGAIEKDKKKS
jgi:hypothetical protein